MQRTQRHIIKVTSRKAGLLAELTHKSKNLYNYTNYLIRQHFFSTGKMLGAYELISQLAKENQTDYRALPARVAVQVIKSLENSWKCYFKALKAYKADPSKFKSKPKPPKYKDKDGHFTAIVINPSQKSNKVKFPKATKIKPMKHYVPNNSTIKQVRIVPQTACFIVEFIYEADELPKVETIDGSFLSLDLGVQNFVTAIDNQGNMPFIIKGEVAKSINQYYNKKRAKLVSIAEVANGRKSTKQINSLTQKRMVKLENFIHQASSYIVNYCIKHRIQCVVIGHNPYWKHYVNLGSRVNQNFVGIPYFRFVCKLKYKLEQVGITMLETEESYTSKCDHLAYETMEHHEHYLGKRVKRGLFKSSTGAVLNADVNGAIGIARKVFGDSVVTQIADRGVGLTPLKINVLMQRSCKSHFEFKKVS